MSEMARVASLGHLRPYMAPRDFRALVEGQDVHPVEPKPVRSRPHCETPSACRAKGEGHCRRCHMSHMAKALHADPEFKAAASARMKALNADPEFKAANAERASARMKALNADPEFKAAASARMKALNAEKLAWCPPDLVDDYRLLARHLGADDAREAIEHQMAHETVVPQCAVCGKVVTGRVGCSLPACPLGRGEK